MDMLGTRQQRIVYLLTYSRVDITKMPSKKRFAEAVLNGWEKFGIEISHWERKQKKEERESRGLVCMM